ncbi:hypothetical protein SLA2020_481360 [Shorea laevis]
MQAWRNWMERTTLNFVDSNLRNGSRSEMRRRIQLGLLCIQENAARRPTMASVVLRHGSNSVSLKVPSKPTYASLSGGARGIYKGTNSIHSEFLTSDLSPRDTIY